MPDTRPPAHGNTPKQSLDQGFEQTGWGKEIREFYEDAVNEPITPEFERLMAEIAKKIRK